jgi:class 3 adenylate cyclase/predicted ATPase
LARDERRDITVLFADVAGFTSMCERLDPEDVHAVMNDCFAALGSAIQEHGGLVDRYFGDAVLALFGAPVIHEDDPARACAAALAMQAFLSGFSEQCKARIGMGLEMRVGIHCGMVVVGGVGSDARLVYGAHGDTMNTAARLQAAAQRGRILVSRELSKRTCGLFEFGPVQQLALKGKEQPIEFRELLGEKTGHSKDDSDGWTLISTVGRDEELEQLVEYLRVCHSCPQWIELVGEQGIGKTRLVHEAARRLPALKLLTIAAESNTRTRPFGLLRLIVHAVITEFIGQSGRWEDRERFCAALSSSGDDLAPYLDVLWHLLAFSKQSVPVPDPDPQALRRTLERSIHILLTRLNHRRPDLVLFLDSFENADIASVDLLQALVTQINRCPIPTLAASRTPRQPMPQVGVLLQIGPLRYEAASEMLTLLLHGAPVPQPMRDEILERAAGLPLFLVEIVRALIDEGILIPQSEGDWVWTETSMKNVSLPASIRMSVAARLDRLPQTEREALCQCSVIGIEFSEAVAKFIWHKQFPQGPAAAGLLRKLEQRGIIREAGHRRYRFCQSAMREVCYETLLFRDRKAFHAAIAEALYEGVYETDSVSPELLAYHYEQGEQWAHAAKTNLQAGDRARALYLNDEAVQRYQRALHAIGQLPSPSQFDLELKIRAYGASAEVLVLMGKYTLAEEAALNMRRHAARGRDRGEANRLLAKVYVHTGRMNEADHLLTEALLAAHSDWSAGEVVANVLYDTADLHWRTGQMEEAHKYLQQCRLAVPSKDQLAPMFLRVDLLEGKIANAQGHFARAAERYASAYEAAERAGSLSERASAANGMGNVARDLADYGEAARHFEKALQIWTQIGDCECIAGAHNNLGNVAMSRGDINEAREHHEVSLRLSHQIGNIQGRGLAYINLAILAIEEGDGRKATGLAKTATETLEESGHGFLNALASVVLGEAYLAYGDLQSATTVFEDILAKYDESHHPLVIAGTWRGLGRITLMQGFYDQAVDWLQRAQDLFERLKRVQESTRTGVYLAQALWQTGEHERARSGLEHAQERFEQIHAKQDVLMAKRLLQELTGPAY